MKKVHEAPHHFVLEHLKNVLELEGISSEVRTPFLGAARGDIPATECWSELWVRNDEEAGRALAVIRSTQEPAEQAPPSWKCPKCGEESEAQFGTCWNCGSTRIRDDA